MKCSACESAKNRVLTTGQSKGQVLRRRECIACHHRWTTAEVNVDKLARMESAVKAIRAFASVNQELING